MSDRQAVALAAAAWIGAWWGGGPPVGMALVAVAVALIARRPWLLCLAAFALTAGRAESDLAGLQHGPSGPYHGWVELTSDPVTDASGAVTVAARIDSHLVELRARDATASALRSRAAGDLVTVVAEVHPAPRRSAWLAGRHIGAQATVTEVGAWHDGPTRWRVANAARDALARSALALPERQRGLYLGLVLGDDRDEPPDIADDFRGAGLAHLLAVSGQNVAFALALVGPALRRSSLRGRLVITVAVLAVFVLVTRAEPSVLRAAFMAGIAALANAIGRSATGIRVLALAVTGLLVADPFLVASVGFQLSVAASAAILLWARPIAARLPGPRPVAEAVSVSVAAQLGVAPVLVTAFGGVPVAGLVANVFAAPAAGPVMAWGIVAGLLGGVLGTGVATVVHVPTRLLVGWLALVARWGARLPLGQLGMPGLVAVGVAIAVASVGRRMGARFAGPVAAAIVVGALLAPGIALRAPAPIATPLGTGAVLWQRDAIVVVIDGRARADAVLAGLRQAGVGRVDLVVVRTSSTAATAVLAAVRQRGEVTDVLGPDVPGERSLVLGGLRVSVEPADGSLTVDVAIEH
ncbi:MAG: ComEC/Rec2 family competence protein [Acidimicrobiales bacterium]